MLKGLQRGKIMESGGMDKEIDGLQLADVLHGLEGRGFLANDQVRPGGQVRCGACGHDFAAPAMAVLAHSRLEGVSDPSDEILVAGVRCPGCNALGTLVLAYGPRARREEAEVLGRLGLLHSRHPSDSFGIRSQVGSGGGRATGLEPPGPGGSSHLAGLAPPMGSPSTDPAANMDQVTKEVLTTYRRIAVVGASATSGKPAHDVPLLMRERGYEVFAVNPTLSQWEGQPAYASLRDVPEPVEIVDVFRRAEETPAIARDAVGVGAKVLWLQLGIKSPEARAIAEQGGLTYIEDHCVNIEYGRLRRLKVAFPKLAP